FSPASGSNRLDVECTIDSQSVFLEVYAPERSYASNEQEKLTSELHDAIKQGVSKCQVEIDITGDFTRDTIHLVVAAVQAADPSIWTTIESFDRIRRVDTGHSLPPVFDREGATIVMLGDSTIQSDATGVVVRWQDQDRR